MTYTAPAEGTPLQKWRDLTRDGVPFDITDSDGQAVDNIDLEERIEAREDGGA